MKKFIVVYHSPRGAWEKMKDAAPENMEKAVEMLKGHPHLEWADGCEIEVHKSMPMPGM